MHWKIISLRFGYSQVEMTSGKLVSAEVLLRIQQPDGSWDLPDGLIDRIECCGLMVTVGHWVLEESCRLLAAWQERGIMLPLSVNLSALQLMHPNMWWRICWNC
ncbi:EAL domain-containing protein (plasmid) [Escherichia coli]|nr:EAL domain-containing protein [Escherichia coli]